MSGRATGDVTTTTTLWQLTQPGGRVARCLVSDRRATWQMVVWSQRGIVAWEHYVTAEAALARAREMEATLARAGWQHPPPPPRGPARVPSPPDGPPSRRWLAEGWARPTMVTAGLAALWLWWGHRRARTTMPEAATPVVEGGARLRSGGFHLSPA